MSDIENILALAAVMGIGVALVVALLTAFVKMTGEDE